MVLVSTASWEPINVSLSLYLNDGSSCIIIMSTKKVQDAARKLAPVLLSIQIKNAHRLSST